MRILLCLALCLVLFSSWGCPGDLSECVKTQDVAVIQTSNVFLDGRFFDNLVVRNNDKVVEAREPRYISIGSKCHKAKFPIHIGVQLFLREILLQNLEFDMPKNSALYFYNGVACDSITSPDYHTHEGEFYRAVQQAINSGLFIDSFRSENTCWVMQYIPDEDDYMRCTQLKGDKQESICGW